MFGKKVWFSRGELIRFGIEHCYISPKNVNKFYDECFSALTESIHDLKKYTEHHPSFKIVGSKMLDSWSLSLENKAYKEIPLEVIRNWK